jgi:ATP-dependent DNA helicase DinG
MTSTTPVTVAPRTFREATSVLADRLPGYEARPEQEKLATAIEDSWADRSILVGQAGTGTGKSLAALIPAVLSGDRVVYSTGTKALQSQIMDKDLPFLAEHLGVDFTYAMLQGIGNYFCMSEASQQLQSDPLVKRAWDEFEADTAGELSGLRDSLSFEIDKKSWSYATTSSDNCTRKKCPFYEGCYFMRAKNKAMAADVVVVNHALVALDGRIFEKARDHFILGHYAHLVLDEAHEFEEFVTMALTVRMNEGTFVALNNDLLSFARRYDNEEITQDSLTLVPGAQSLFRVLEEGRIKQADAMQHSDIVMALMTPLGRIFEALEKYSKSDFETPKEQSNFTRLHQRVQNLVQGLGDFLLSNDQDNVRFIEITHGRKYPKSLEIVPVTVAPWLRANLWQEVAPTLISATLLVNGKADYIVRRLGLDTAPVVTVDVGTPFDYQTNSQLYIPQHIVPPAGKDREKWEQDIIPLMRQLVEASGGRALLLFTSNSAMNKTFEILSPQLNFDCKRQGDLPNEALTRWFREEETSVLFATRSFFTGIDIQGDSLSMVIIDKLPFPVPTEPVFEARCEEVERRGGQSFMEMSVPIMTLILQQAAGRLIRTKRDRGVIAIMDPRLKTKGYGHTICKSLPMPQVYDLNDVDRFFA